MAATEHRFRVMASAVQIIVVDPHAGALEQAERRLQQLEASWSRFLPASDVSAINAASDRWVPVSAHTIRLLDAMIEAATITDGLFDPTLLHEVIATIEFGQFGTPAKPEIVEQMVEIGLSRIVFGLPPAGADKVIPLLDRYAELAKQYS